MTKISLILDTRKSSQNRDGQFPIALRIHHQRTRLLRLPYATSPTGWHPTEHRLLKSVKENRSLNCAKINYTLQQNLQSARDIVQELKNEVRPFSIDELCERIQARLEGIPVEIKKAKSRNGLMLRDWLEEMSAIKIRLNKTTSAIWYQEGVEAFLKMKQMDDMPMAALQVTDLKEFVIHNQVRGNSMNTISSYLRALRALYNAALKDDRLFMVKYPFHHFKVPATTRTKKRAISKEEILRIRDLSYPPGSPLWHARNYALIMFYCRGMNFIDLVKLKKSNIQHGRILYGRSKTDEPLSVGITEDLREILKYYLWNDYQDDSLFPANYDGSHEHYEKYKTLRRRMNENLATIARDAGIQEKLTTYTIRHSWATIAKYMGISTEIISESLGHHSLQTTEVYLKGFNEKVLDEANELITK